MAGEVTIERVKELAVAWFLALDQHVPIEQIYTMLADTDLNMKFPDGDIRDYDSFKTWYDRVTNIFFDENHNLVSVSGSIENDVAKVRVIVAWQASWFEPPAAKSKRTSMNATQDWVVRPSSKNALGLEIVGYNATAEPFTYAPGFAQL